MKHDQSMQILIRTIQSGWPNERRRCPKQIQDFWNIRDELAIVDDESSPLVIKGHRIVIPIEQRDEILQQLHIGHFVIEKTKQRVRDAVYWPRKMLDMPRAPVGTTEGTHGEHTDSDETIPDGDRRSVRVRWKALSVTARLLQPLHRSREALLNPCIIHHHEDERNHGQTRYTRRGIFRQWAAVLMRGICIICKHMGIRPLDIQSPIPTVEWIGREGRADCEEDRNEGNGIGSRPLHRSTGVPTVRRLFRAAECHLHSC